MSINSASNPRKLNRIFLVLVFALVLVLSASAQVTEYCDVTAGAVETPHDEYQATQLPAEVGKPVQWVKQVDVQNLYDQAETELLVSIPEDAQNVVVLDMATDAELDADVGVGVVTIKDSLGFNEQKSYLIKYETDSPYQTETNLEREGETLVKNVIVSSEYHYEDVLTYTYIPEIPIDGAIDKIRIYWNIDGVRTDVTDDPDFNVQFYDTNNNGMYDRISWVTPHLSTQIFEIVIISDADPGSYSSIGISLLSPADGEYITSNSKVRFNYSVRYNGSTTVYCNLTVDGAVRRQNIQTATDTEITTYFNLTSGNHDWNVKCAGDDGSVNTSETRQFTIDLDRPAVQLNTPDYHVSYTNTIDLNFTPIDNRYPVMVCSLSVNGALEQTGIVVNNATKRTISLSGLTNGVYDWNVSCEDAAGNLGSSEERVFYISAGTPSEFNISPNKASYSIGEVGYLIINAKAGSNLTLFVDTPLHDSFFRYYNGKSFPLVEMLNFTSNAGTYSIDGIFSHGGELYIVKTSLDVSNSFNVEIESNETTGIPGDVFRFEVNASGGIGGVNYEWDFGDGKEANGTDVTHSYSSVGEYEVEVTATDSRNNKVTDIQKINIYRKHHVKITVRELQTQHVMENVPVEVDDERKLTDSKGFVEFVVYEGKRRIYIAHPGYEWVKQVRNITGNLSLTIDLNNTGITDYTPTVLSEQDNKTAEAESGANSEAEKLLAQVSTAIENLESGDEATKAVIAALEIEENLQQARKTLRQIIRDLGNAETSRNMTAQQKEERIKEINKRLDEIENAFTAVDVKDTTEYVDYPKSSDVAMLSAEYLRFRNVEYSDKLKEKYIEQNTELQSSITINTRLSIVEMSRVSGKTVKAAVVINKITQQPVSTDDVVLLEYIPKEVAQSASEIKKVTAFDVVKSDPILKFDPKLTSYSYYLEKQLGIEDLKKTKHVLLIEPADEDGGGLVGVTGLSILPRLKIGNPKLLAQIIIISILLIAYITYHFELIDKLRERRKRKQRAGTDLAYRPESTFNAVARRVKSFMDEEEALLMKELSHIKTLIMAAHGHAENRKHDYAATTYTQVMGAYKDLSKEAKQKIHPETKQLYSKILVSKIDHLIDEAHAHIRSSHHSKAKSHYSEIKKIYTQLEKEHRAAVSERCMQLHAALFETSLA